MVKKRISLIILLALLSWTIFSVIKQRNLFDWAADSSLEIEPSESAISQIFDAKKPAQGDLAKLSLPPGFSISYFADNVPGARSIAVAEQGTIVFVGTRDKTVYAITDPDLNGVSNEIVKVATNLNSPNGVAVKDGALYVAEISRILKYPNISSTFRGKPTPQVVYDDYPRDTHHGWKYLSFGPDGLLYVPIGAPCNNCLDKGKYARLTTLDLNSPNQITYATGIRNTVGFDWNPVDGSLWFTDNGRDGLGDDTPKDELNRINNPGDHFGFPQCHGYDTADPQLGNPDSCGDQQKPALELGPHVASLGMKFYHGEMFPQEYKKRIIIAEHGSWNRTEPIGYRLTSVDIEGQSASNYQTFVDGWLVGEEAWGRPVDLAELPDGSILVSDDKAGAIYRISYHEN